MTQPTDAQIERAAKAIKHCMMGPMAYEAMAKAALTAAAEVGDQIIWEMWREGDIKDKQDVINATVECCAKFAENYFEMEYEKAYGEMIADAMREALLKP